MSLHYYLRNTQTTNRFVSMRTSPTVLTFGSNLSQLADVSCNVFIHCGAAMPSATSSLVE